MEGQNMRGALILPYPHDSCSGWVAAATYGGAGWGGLALNPCSGQAAGAPSSTYWDAPPTFHSPGPLFGGQAAGVPKAAIQMSVCCVGEGASRGQTPLGGCHPVGELEAPLLEALPASACQLLPL